MAIFQGKFQPGKKGFFQGESYLGKWPYYTPQNPRPAKKAIVGWNFFEAKSGKLKFQPRNPRHVNWSFLGWGIKSPNFTLKKNSTRKMTIFHPEKSQAWKKASFWVDFFQSFSFDRTGEKPYNQPRNSAFDLESLKNPTFHFPTQRTCPTESSHN